MRAAGKGGPATCVQSLLWDNRCLKATPTGFQQLFEEVMGQLEGKRFTPIKPHGGEGDRKADGVLDRGRVVFQVYSPNDLKLSKIKRKISEDLRGAAEHWSDVIERWVFVYNRRVARAVAPQIVGQLNDYQEKFPDIEIDQLHDGDLWRRLRDELSLEERAELLGPIPGDWDGAFVPNTDKADDHREKIGRSRVVLLQPRDRPIDPSSVMEALEPEVPFGSPYRLERTFDLGWEREAALQREEVSELIERASEQCARFAVFSHAPIPLAIHLGSVLTDRLDVRLFQYHRDAGVWSWDPLGAADEIDSLVQVYGLPAEASPGVEDVGVRFSLSAFVTDADVEGALPEGASKIHLSVDDPDRLWLRQESQIEELRRVYRATWKQVSRKFPDARRIHVFYAGPAPAAIALGQSHNPRMHPSLLLYEYDRTNPPRYEPALKLGG